MDFDLFTSLITSKLEESKLAYMNSNAKIVLARDFPKLDVSGEVLTDLKKGTVVQVRRWAAGELVKAGAASYESAPADLALVRQIEWRERNNPGDLQELPPSFYQGLWQMISDEQGLGQSAQARNLRDMLVDLLSLRIGKILSASRRSAGSELVRKLTTEEKLLFEAVSTIVEAWRQGMMAAGEGSAEEAHASE